jgi:hypothetical protein
VVLVSFFGADQCSKSSVPLQLSFAAQVIMPADTFKEVLYQKLQFPLYFEVKNIMKARVNESTFSRASNF